MTLLTEFMEVFAETAEKICAEEGKPLDGMISLEELSAENSLYAELGEGFQDTLYFDKGSILILPVLILCRNTNQQRCAEQLSDICTELQRKKEYPNGQTFAWMDTEVAKYPSKIGRDEDGTYHYSCILNCKLYLESGD